jgi:signal transduction histidine kinase
VLNLWVVDGFEEASRSERREIVGGTEEFVRTVTHELKNPLGAAELALQMLEDEEIMTSPAERERYRKMVVRNLKRGRVLLDDLRMRALPDLGFAPSWEWIPLTEVLQDVFAEVLPTAETQGVRLHADDIPTSWEVPAREAKLVLMNLVWNAGRYSDPINGGLLLWAVEADRVSSREPLEQFREGLGWG